MTTSSAPLDAAPKIAVWLRFVLAFTSAPCFSSNLTASGLRLAAADISATAPLPATASGSAFFASNNSIASTLPARAANINAVCPLMLAMLGLAPLLSRSFSGAISKRSDAARLSGVRSLSVLALISAPRARRRRIFSMSLTAQCRGVEFRSFARIDFRARLDQPFHRSSVPKPAAW